MDGMLHGAASSLFGILYAEDFDDPPDDEHDGAGSAEPEPPPLTKADVDAACAAAVDAARLEWKASHEQKRVDVIASLGTALAGIRDSTESAALAAAEGTVATILSIVTGLLPQFSREHGPAEVRALLARLLPTIRSQSRINVRVHPDMVLPIQRDLVDLDPDLAAMIDVFGAPIERGDVKVGWENGSTARDSRQIIQAMQDALGELGLHHPVENPAKRKMAYAD